MESRAKLLGHPVHPMLIVLPLGLFIGAVVFDALSIWRGNVILAAVGFWNIAGGVIGGVVAGGFGLIGLFAVSEGPRAALRSHRLVRDSERHSREADRPAARSQQRGRGRGLCRGLADAEQRRR